MKRNAKIYFKTFLIYFGNAKELEKKFYKNYSLNKIEMKELK